MMSFSFSQAETARFMLVGGGIPAVFCVSYLVTYLRCRKSEEFLQKKKLFLRILIGLFVLQAGFALVHAVVLDGPWREVFTLITLPFFAIPIAAYSLIGCSIFRRRQAERLTYLVPILVTVLFVLSFVSISLLPRPHRVYAPALEPELPREPGFMERLGVDSLKFKAPRSLGEWLFVLWTWPLTGVLS